jgi:hypothetical protein
MAAVRANFRRDHFQFLKALQAIAGKIRNPDGATL